MAHYEILLSSTTLDKVLLYKTELDQKNANSGNYLQKEINSMVGKGKSLEQINCEQFIQIILSTKKVCCFAEKEIIGDGSDWNFRELQILGDIAVGMKVEVYDNGAWDPYEKAFKTHESPFSANLVFVPGPLLHGARFRGSTPDFEQITNKGQIDQIKYNELIKNRIMPVFAYANENAKQEKKKALVVIPGLGCGAFAGHFRGKMGAFLNEALQSILREYLFLNIACVRYDPFSECKDYEEVINNVLFRLRRKVGHLGKPQLSSVKDFEEKEDEFENCTLYKVVAWDHVSLPGNDYFLGNRSTDDGVTAAATNSMSVITSISGQYIKNHYQPPKGAGTWGSVVDKNNTRLIADNNVKISLPDGSLVGLCQYINN